MQLCRWLPERHLIFVGDSSFGTHDLVQAVTQRATLIICATVHHVEICFRAGGATVRLRFGKLAFAAPQSTLRFGSSLTTRPSHSQGGGERAQPLTENVG